MIPIDKVHHFVYGYAIASVFQIHWVAMIAAAVVAGVAKEAYDVYKGGKWDMADLICTVGGGIFSASWTLGMQSI